MTYADGNILGSGEEPVDQHSHEGRVQTVLRRQKSEFGVGHALGNDDGTDSDTGDQVTSSPLEVVTADPLDEWEQADEVIEHLTAIGDDGPEPCKGRGLFFEEAVGAHDRVRAIARLWAGSGGGVAIVELDTKTLCEAMANLGARGLRHGERMQKRKGSAMTRSERKCGGDGALYVVEGSERVGNGNLR